MIAVAIALAVLLTVAIHRMSIYESLIEEQASEIDRLRRERAK